MKLSVVALRGSSIEARRKKLTISKLLDLKLDESSGIHLQRTKSQEVLWNFKLKLILFPCKELPYLQQLVTAILHRYADLERAL